MSNYSDFVPNSMLGRLARDGVHNLVDTDGDAEIYVEFYDHPVDGETHVRMFLPGDKTFQPDYIATDEHKRRFPKQWKAFEDKTEQHAGETFLEDVAWIDPAMRYDLKAKGIFTLEGLAAVSDGNLQELGTGAGRVRDRAKEELERGRKADAFDDQQATIADLTKRLAALEGQQGGDRKPRGERQGA